MKKFIGKVISCVLALVLLVTISLNAAPNCVQADSLYIRKIVSVVYDDSGSMKYDVETLQNDTKKWAYANYAMQSFCGLLNDDDQLFVTYMSDVFKNKKNPVEYDLSAAQIQNSVDSIRNSANNEDTGTPFDSLEIAFDKLKSVNDSNVNTQYWLVVITDGQFNNGKVTVDELDDYLKECSDSVMPNGSNPNISFLAIGDDAVKPSSSVSKNLFVYQSSGTDEIVNVMSLMADKVSGRVRVDSDQIKVIDSKTIEFSTAIPLMNLAVLSQKSESKVLSIYDSSGSRVNISKTATIEYPVCEGLVTDTSLSGTTTLASNYPASLAAGTYQIVFDSDVDINKLVVMMEPALEIRMTLTLDGKVIDASELKSSQENQILDVSCKIFEVGTENEISPTLLPADTSYSLEIIENGQVVKSSTSSGMSIAGYSLSRNSTEIIGIVEIQGFNPIVISVNKFNPEPFIVYTLDVTQPEDFSMSIEELKENSSKVYFTIYADGEKVTKSEAEALDFNVTTDTGLSGTVKYEEDGRISFLPVYCDPISSIPIGETIITGTLNEGISKTATVSIIEVVYEVVVEQPTNFSMTIDELKSNEECVSFSIYANGEKLLPNQYIEEEFIIDSDISGDISYLDDGSIAFCPKYQDPVEKVPTGDITVKGTFIGSVSGVGTIYIKPLEYEIRLVTVKAPEINRRQLLNNTEGLEFQLYVDGKKLDKTEVEAASIGIEINEEYAKYIELNTSINSDGTIKVVPVSELGYWKSRWLIRTGDIVVTATYAGDSEVGKIGVIFDSKRDPWPFVFPVLALVVLVGEFVKPRFKYSSKIYTYNFTSAGGDINANKGPTKRLYRCWTILVPFVPDTKKIGSIRVKAKGLFSTGRIEVKVSRNVNLWRVNSSTINHSNPYLNFSAYNLTSIEDVKIEVSIGDKIASSRSDAHKTGKLYMYE